MAMIQELSRQLQDVLSTQDSVETAKVCRAIVEEGVRTICRKLGKEANPTAGLLELLSRPDVSGFVDDSEVSQGLEFVRILGGNAEHGRHIKKTHAQFAASACADFIDVLDAKLTGDKLPAKKAKDSEDATRRLYIDIYLGEAGWDVLDEKGLSLPEKAAIEIEIPGMPNPAGKGYADYVLYDKGGRPLAVVEAKKAGLDPIKGREQLRLYGELLARQCGYVPVLYYSNGYETWVMDGIYPDRRVVAFHTADELQRIIQRRERGDITSIRINPAITGRPYQITAITKMCEKFNRKERAGLLVMATGTGKTRTVVSLVDVLSRNNWITNVLFLADRTSLVEQAHDAFREHLPDYTRSVLSDKNLLGSPNARIMFSTYQTMINKIDGKEKAFTSGRFDLIIVDEAHRSIFNKYRSICTYFDALLVGLTATPRGEVDKSTYSIFGCENDVPDYDYSMQQGFDDGFLRPYKVLNRRSLILNEGISYQKLTEDEKRQLDEAYDGEGPRRGPRGEDAGRDRRAEHLREGVQHRHVQPGSRRPHGEWAQGRWGRSAGEDHHLRLQPQARASDRRAVQQALSRKGEREVLPACRQHHQLLRRADPQVQERSGVPDRRLRGHARHGRGCAVDPESRLLQARPLAHQVRPDGRAWNAVLRERLRPGPSQGLLPDLRLLRELRVLRGAPGGAGTEVGAFRFPAHLRHARLCAL